MSLFSRCQFSARRGRKGWVFGSAPIEGSNGNALHLSEKIPFWSKGSGKLLLTGVLPALDAQREWHQQDGKLYLWAPDDADPNELVVEATRRRWAFDPAERSHVEVQGLRIFAASINMEGAEHCTVDNCRIRYASFDRSIRGGFNRDKGMNADSEGLGVVVGGSNNTIRNSVVTYCVGDGISVYGTNNTVENCVVHDCNLSASDCAPVNCTGRGHVVRNCTLFNAGRSVLLHRRLKQGRIEHNEIFNAGLMTGDLGATYTFQTDGEGTVIAFNRVHDVQCHTGVGIYIDNASPNHLIHHNLCYNVTDCGIRLNTPTRDVLLYNNTLCQNGKSLAWWGSRGNNDQQGVRVINNILTNSVSLGERAMSRSNYTEKDPGFLDPQNNDFRLRPNSPCIDAGEVIDGITEKHVGKAPDLGCFEQGPAISRSPAAASQIFCSVGYPQDLDSTASHKQPRCWLSRQNCRTGSEASSKPTGTGIMRIWPSSYYRVRGRCPRLDRRTSSAPSVWDSGRMTRAMASSSSI